MKYLSTFIITTTTFIALTAGFNWWVDPFGMHWSPVVSGVNEIKPEAGKRSRISKAYRASAVKPSVLFVGNSRVEMGLDPNHKLFAGEQVYNQGMPGAGLGMQVDYALNAMADSPELHTLIVGVDFLDFLIRAESNKARETQRRSQPGYWPRLSSLANDNSENTIFRLKEKAAMLLSLDAVSASVKTLLKQSSSVSSITNLGFNTAQTYLNILRHEGIKPLFVQKLEELNKRLLSKNLTIRSPDTEALTQPFLQLQKLLDKASETNLSVYLFISPYHYSYLQLLDDLNYRNDFFQWKSQLVNLSSNYPSNRVQLWDFSNLNQYTLEAVPLNTGNQEMQWYWEPAHYKKELGDLIIERILSLKANSNFGVRLSANNISSVVEHDRITIDSSKNQWGKLKKNLDILEQQ